MSDPMESSENREHHDLYFAHASDEQKSTLEYILFGGGGVLTGKSKKPPEKSQAIVLGTLHFEGAVIIVIFVVMSTLQYPP